MIAGASNGWLWAWQYIPPDIVAKWLSDQEQHTDDDENQNEDEDQDPMEQVDDTEPENSKPDTLSTLETDFDDST